MIVIHGASLSSLVLLEQSLTGLPRKRLHLFQGTIAMCFVQQTTAKDQGQKRQAAHIELQQVKKGHRIKLKYVYILNLKHNRPPPKKPQLTIHLNFFCTRISECNWICMWINSFGWRQLALWRLSLLAYGWGQQTGSQVGAAREAGAARAARAAT